MASVPVQKRDDFWTRLKRGLLRMLPLGRSTATGSSGTNNLNKLQENPPVEHFAQGYPRFAALIAADQTFALCRRFSRLRARLLLLKQDELSQLEAQLDAVDTNDPVPLRLGSSRLDNNPERRRLLSLVDVALSEYDTFIERNQRMLLQHPAKGRNSRSLQNWLKGNACVARDEFRYLGANDLIQAVPLQDEAFAQFSELLEDTLTVMPKLTRKIFGHDTSSDTHVFVSSGRVLPRIARAIVLTFLIGLLVAPILICNALHESQIRILVVAFACAILVICMSLLTKAKTIEIFVAGATVNNWIRASTGKRIIHLTISIEALMHLGE